MSRIRNPVEVRLALMFDLLFTWATEGQFINPSSTWLGDCSTHIQAHGSNVVKLGDTWCWFGEDYTPANDPDKRYIACYSSTNLWTGPFATRSCNGPISTRKF